MSPDGIDRATAEKERGLLDMDYATPCPECGGVVFEWWDSDTCRGCEDSNEERSTEQTTLMTDGGTVENGTYRVYCPDHGAGTTVDSAFVARQLSKHHNAEYGCDSEWRSVDTGVNHEDGGSR